MEQYKELQRAATHGTKKLISRNQAMEKAITLLPELADNQDKLIDVYESQPEVAAVILEKFYDGISIEDFSKEYLGKDYTGKPEGKSLSEDDIRADERSKMQKEQVDSHIESLFIKAKLTEADAKKVMDEFLDLAEGKTLTKEKATKIFNYAYNSVRPKPVEDKDTKVIKKTSPGSGSKG